MPMFDIMAENDRGMHPDIQEYQECRSLGNCFYRPSLKLPQAAHLAFRVPTAATPHVPRMQKQLES
eukprot:12907239-Prorocentrum_lima.AAC.1